MTEDPVSMIEQFYDLIRSGKGTMAVGVAATLMVWLLRTVLAKRVSFFETPLGGYILGFGIPLLTYVSTALAAENAQITFSLFVNAFGAGFVASGGWETLRDFLTKMNKPPSVTMPKATIVSMMLIVSMSISCGASARETTIKATFETTNVLRESFVKWDGDHQTQLVMSSKSRDEAVSKLSDYRESREKVTIAFVAIYQAITAAILLGDDRSLATMLEILKSLETLYQEIKK